MSCKAHKPWKKSLVAILAVLGSFGAVYAAEKASNTHVLEPGPMKLDVTLDGVIIPENLVPVKVEASAWTNFQVSEAAEHGSVVREGDVLVKFESRDLKEAIAELEYSQKVSALTLQEAKEDLQRSKILTKMELEATKLGYDSKVEDLQRREVVGKRRQAEDHARMAERQEKAMQYAKQELEQLEKMYEADDLVEETEQMMLQRYRDNFEQRKFSYERFKEDWQHQKDVVLPRKEAETKYDLEKAKLSYEQSKSKLESGLQKKEFALRKQKLQHERNEEKLAKLKSDLDKLVVRAPADGVIYYGNHTNGKWTEIPKMMGKLRPGGKVANHEHIMTIVQRGPLWARCIVPEKMITRVRPSGVECTVEAYPGQMFYGRITEVSSVPIAPGQYLARVALDSAPSKCELHPGMGCKVKATAFAKKDALWVPATAVKRDDWTGEDYVVVVTEEDEQRRTVKLGNRTNSRVEVLAGLSVGDKVKANVNAR